MEFCCAQSVVSDSLESYGLPSPWDFPGKNTGVGCHFLLHVSREKHDLKRYMHPNVHCSTVYNSQDREATYMFIDRGMSKEDVHSGIQCVNNGILLSHKRNEVMPLAATWMDLETFILSEAREGEIS